MVGKGGILVGRISFGTTSCVRRQAKHSNQRDHHEMTQPLNKCLGKIFNASLHLILGVDAIEGIVAMPLMQSYAMSLLLSTICLTPKQGRRRYNWHLHLMHSNNYLFWYQQLVPATTNRISSTCSPLPINSNSRLVDGFLLHSIISINLVIEHLRRLLGYSSTIQGDSWPRCRKISRIQSICDQRNYI